MKIEVGRALSVNRPSPQSFPKNTTQLPQGPVFGRFTRKAQNVAFPQRTPAYTSAIPRMPMRLLFGSVIDSSVPPYGVRSKL